MVDPVDETYSNVIQAKISHIFGQYHAKTATVTSLDRCQRDHLGIKG